MLILLSAVARAALCTDAPVDELEDAMAELLEAHQRVDEFAFDVAVKQLDAAVSCLDGPPPATTLARLHHAMALRSFVNGQTRAARRSLAALRLLDPRWEPPFPDGHPFTTLWEAATDPGPVERVGSIEPQIWVVDGIERSEVPLERGFLLQVKQPDGKHRLSTYLFDPDDVPDLGQGKATDRNATPWTTSLRLAGIGRVHQQRQVADGTTALADQQAGGVGGGLGATLRVTPTAVVGLEAGLAALPGDDLVAGRGTSLEAHLLGLLGAGVAQVGDHVLFAAGRIGLTTDTAHAWPGDAQRVQPTTAQLFGPSLGFEAGLRRRQQQVDLTVDAALARATVPWLLDAELGLTQLLGESLGLRLAAAGRTTSQPVLDGEAPVGRAGQSELRALVGLELVR